MSAPIADERLLELLLDRGPEAERELAELRAEPDAAARLAALERLLGDAAAAVRLPRALEQERSLAARVLSLTTREDLSWRGDLRLVGGYLRERMRESRLARTLAALLLGNLTIGPVLAVAWVLVHEPEPERDLFFRVEPAAAEPLAGAEDGLAPLAEDAPAIEGLARRDWLEAQHAENRLRRARFLLAHGAVPAPGPEPVSAGAPLVVRLLDARARLSAGAPWPEWLDDAAWTRGAAPSDDLDLVAAALYVEILLDRFVLTGERAPRFHGALARLAEAAAAAGPARRLAEAALARSASYGLRDRAPEPPREDPIDPAWRADLAAALGALGSLAEDPVVRAWTGSER